MNQITRNNHYVPQLYLKQWSKDQHRIYTYRILVPRKDYDLWKLCSIRSVASFRDLYTEISNGEEIDEFERWLESEYEVPAQGAISKVIKDESLSLPDWEHLALFLAAQDVRTPTNYLNSINRWNTTLPDLLENTLKEAIQQIEQPTTHKPRQAEDNDDSIKYFQKIVRVEVIQQDDSRERLISASMVAGRALWLESQRFLLTKTAKTLLNHKWGIGEPASGTEWFTSDHPVVRLNFYGREYDLEGGWGNPGTDLLMPLSPRHLLFTEIGKDIPDRFAFSAERTHLIQKCLAERALRWIYAREPMKVVSEYRARQVDLAAFKAEEDQVKKWHREQSDGGGS